MIILLLAAFVCPPDQKLKLDLAEWKKATLQAKAGSKEQELQFAALRFRNFEGECEEPAHVQGVDVFDAHLTGEGDKLVQVRLRSCSKKPQELISLRIAVLVPLGGGELCKLDGEDLSLDQLASDKPCTNAAKLPRTLDFAQGRISVRDQSGSCTREGGTSSTKLSLYEVQGWSLRKIFETPTWDSTTQAQGRQLVQRWNVSFSGDGLRVQRCIDGGECDDPEEWSYSKPGGKYVPARK